MRRTLLLFSCVLFSSSALKPPATTTTVLVVGGSGRVGGSTVKWLDKMSGGDGSLRVVVGGRSQERFDKMKSRFEEQDVGFALVDLDDPSSLDDALRDVDAVVHTAGPFQGVRRATVLEAAIRRRGIVYVDVCDETALCVEMKDLSGACKEADVIAVTSCGIWPGASALMAVDCVDQVSRDDQEEPVSIDFSFFTAGTGGAGPTIVSATFLLLVTPALVYSRGSRIEKEAWSEPRRVDFGGGVGERTVRLLDCPDVLTVAETVRKKRPVRDAESRFATSPEFWNLGFGAAKDFLPRTLLSDRSAMQALAIFSEPIVRAVDRLVGSTNVMRVEASTATKSVVKQHTHQDLEAAVGIATAAFTLELLAQRQQSSTAGRGVRWPAELDPDLRSAILSRVVNAPGTIEYSTSSS